MHKLKTCLVFVTIFCIFTKSFGHFAPEPSQQISHYIDQHRSQSMAFFEKIININSHTENFSGVRQVGSEFENELKKLGFKTYWQDMSQLNRAGNLFAIRHGNKGPRILLIGHLDTIFPASKKNNFQYLPNNWAKGIGVSDMKGGDLVMLQALQALHELKLLEDTTIAIALMGDEENPAHPTSVSRSELIKLAKSTDVVLDFESGPPSIGRRGVTTWQLSTEGVQQHSSLIWQPPVGHGAVYEIARILTQFEKRFSQVENLTINPGMIYGGNSINYDHAKQSAVAAGRFNVVAKYSFAAGDLRYISNQQKCEVETTMEKIVKDHSPRAQTNITFTDLVDPMTPNKNNLKLLKELQTIHYKLTGKKLHPLPAKLRGGGDISFIAAYVPAGLVGLGPIGQFEHSVDEIVDLNSIQLASKQVAILIYNLTHHSET